MENAEENVEAFRGEVLRLLLKISGGHCTEERQSKRDRCSRFNILENALKKTTTKE